MSQEPSLCPVEPQCDHCESVFERVVVSYLQRGGTVVAWTLLPSFLDPGPYSFQLQVGDTANPDADDWEDVGAPVVDAFVAIDGQQRIWGSTLYTHYRVVLTTPQGVYTSLPVRLDGTLSPADWRIAQLIVANKMTEYRLDPSTQYGVILKRRVSGQRCPRCTSELTDDVKDGECAVCLGTGYRCGFYYPTGCAWIKPLQRARHRPQLDAASNRGTVNDVTIRVEMLITHLLTYEDVWVNLRTDDRYYVQEVVHLQEVRGFPIVGQVELRLAKASNIIYALQIPQQDDLRRQFGG